LHGIYYLSGDLKKNETTVYKAGLVREKNLEAAKNRLAKAASCHLFSLQCADIKNVAMTLLADGYGENGKNNRSTAPISCSNAHRRVAADLTEEKSIPESQSKYFDQEKEKEKPKSIDQQESISGTKSKKSEPKSTTAKPAEVVKQQTTTKKNEKKRPTTTSKMGSPPKKQATLTNFFKKP